VYRATHHQTWRRSSYCGSAACLEVAHEEGAFYVRDSKDPAGPVLAFTSDQARAFLTAVKKGALR
jgi:hypothetical protein